MKRTHLITTMAIFVAIGTIGAQILWFPAGVAKAYPVQHAVNVMAAVILGPAPAVMIAFMIGLLRNLLGLGSILAFPGSMIGALFAGYCYRLSRRMVFAAIGESIGTGIIGSLFCVPIANLLMGSAVGLLFFFPSFLISSVCGSFIGWIIVVRLKQRNVIEEI